VDSERNLQGSEGTDYITQGSQVEKLPTLKDEKCRARLMTDVASQWDLVLIVDTNSNVILLELRQVNRRLVTSTCKKMIHTIKELKMVEQSPKDVRKEEEKKKSPNHSSKPRKENVKRRKFIVKERLKGRKVRILIDSGSDLNCVSEKFMKRVGLPKRRSKKGI
jgi:hypothetical protein